MHLCKGKVHKNDRRSSGGTLQQKETKNDLKTAKKYIGEIEEIEEIKDKVLVKEDIEEIEDVPKILLTEMLNDILAEMLKISKNGCCSCFADLSF